jgi:hypothetical protein
MRVKTGGQPIPLSRSMRDSTYVHDYLGAGLSKLTLGETDDYAGYVPKVSFS